MQNWIECLNRLLYFFHLSLSSFKLSEYVKFIQEPRVLIISACLQNMLYLLDNNIRLLDTKWIEGGGLCHKLCNDRLQCAVQAGSSFA